MTVKHEAAQMRSEALQNYVKNSSAETLRQSIKKHKELAQHLHPMARRKI